jgi:hypothetical protein
MEYELLRRPPTAPELAHAAPLWTRPPARSRTAATGGRPAPALHSLKNISLQHDERMSVFQRVPSTDTAHVVQLAGGVMQFDGFWDYWTPFWERAKAAHNRGIVEAVLLSLSGMMAVINYAGKGSGKVGGVFAAIFGAAAALDDAISAIQACINDTGTPTEIRDKRATAVKKVAFAIVAAVQLAQVTEDSSLAGVLGSAVALLSSYWDVYAKWGEGPEQQPLL